MFGIQEDSGLASLGSIPESACSWTGWEVWEIPVIEVFGDPRLLWDVVGGGRREEKV